MRIFFFYFIIGLIQILIVWPSFFVNLCVLLCGSVLMNSTVPTGSWQFWTHFIRTTFHRVAVTGSTERGTETVPDCLACEYSRFSFIQFPHIEWMFSRNVPSSGSLGRLRIIGRYEKPRRSRIPQSQVRVSPGFSSLLSFSFNDNFYLFNFLFVRTPLHAVSNTDLSTRLENCGKINFNTNGRL